MAWFYQIHDAKGAVISKGGVFATQHAAISAGKAEVGRLKRTGNIPASGFGMLTAERDLAPWQPTHFGGSVAEPDNGCGGRRGR
jgi:hypothetical protein